MKKLLSVVMAVIMLMTTLVSATTAFAAENTSISTGYATSGTAGTLSWYVSSGTLHIEGTGEMLNYTSSSAPWNDALYDVTSVVIADTVQSIGDYAFFYAKKLRSATLGNGIKRIGKEAFYSCSNLETVNIPDNVAEIESYAFAYCEAITDISSKCPAKLSDRVFYGCKALKTINLTNAKFVGSYSLYSCSSLTSVNLPKATIDSYLFSYSENNASSITVGSLKNDALSHADSLQTLYIKGSSIGDYGVYSCINLKKVISDAKTVGNNAFRNCKALTEVSMPKATKIGKYAFYEDKNIKTVKLGKINTINEYAFSYCTGLKTVTGTSNLKKVMEGAFAMDSKIAKFTAPKKITYIGNSAFGNCKNMNSAFNFANVTYVGPLAFANCQKLATTINFTKVKEIGSKAFLNCKKLKGNTTGSKITKIESNAFVGCSKINSLYIPSCCKSIGYEAFAKKITKISVTSYGYISAEYITTSNKIKLVGNKGSEAQSYARLYKSNFSYGVQKISVSKKSVNLKKKGSANVYVTSITPYNAGNKKVAWTTSNKKIATVSSSGAIKGVSKGSCYVYCKATDGSLKQAKIKVTVK